MTAFTLAVPAGRPYADTVGRVCEALPTPDRAARPADVTPRRP
ncbi:hypothetical protein [Nocardioides pocheonensis]|jgi:hypothetical protein|nr:hypothetical protein [Nocardioides pocheonensis]